MAKLKIIFISAFLFCFVVQDIAPNSLANDKQVKFINNSASVEKIAFYSGRNGNNEIYVMNVDGSEVINLTNNPASDLCPAISPLGDKIVFLSDRDGNTEIYTMDADGSNIKRLTNTTEAEEHPSWSKNGNKIFFVKDYMSRTEIWIMNSDGINPQRLTNNSARDERPFLSPDGSTILFMSNRDGNYEIYLMNADGNNQHKITNTSVNEIFPTWSPDGSKLAYSLNVLISGIPQAEIHVIKADGSGDTTLTNAPGRDENPCWSTDGNSIVFQSERDGNFEIYSMKADGSNQTRLTTHNDWDGWSSYGNFTVTVLEDDKKINLLNNKFQLYDNFPNPFNHITKISWRSPVSGWQTLKIYNVLGNEIATLVNDVKPAGSYETIFDATHLSSGTYFYKLIAGDYVETKKMVLMK